jgi:hypothetical protein
MAGGKGKCPKCGTILRIPAAASSEAEAPARPAAPKPRPSQSAIQEEKALKTRQRAAEEARADDEGEPAEEEESAPVARKKKKRKKSRALLFGLIGGGCFGLLLLCSGIGGLAWWYFFTGGIDDDLKFMPANCQVVASIRFDQLLQSDVFKELRRDIPQIDQGMKASLNQDSGIATEDIEQMLFGVGANDQDVIVVIHTKKAVESRDIVSKIKGATYTEAKVGKYSVQEPQNALQPAICVVDKKRVVVGKKESLRAVLQRDKKPEFSKNLQEAIKATDFSKTVAFAMDAKAGRSNPAGGLGMLGANKDVFGALEKTNGIAAQFKIGSDVRWEMTLLCQDAASAKDVKKLIDGFLVMGKNNKDMPQEVRDLMELNLKVDGNKVTGGNTFKVSPLIKTFKQQQQKKMF